MTEQNPMGYKPIPKLLLKLTIPAIIANLTNALYNIIDQIFIGQGIGYLGNAATNIAFPLSTICLAIALLIGLGSSATFSLELGKGNVETSRKTVGTAVSTILITGSIIAILVIIFLEPLMLLFGATPEVLDYAMIYSGITAIGIPFTILTSGMNQIIRSDGHATYAMSTVISGAILNVILDYVFIFPLNMGITGAAIATVVSQITSAAMVIAYLPRFEFVKLQIRDFIPNAIILSSVIALGMNGLIFQLGNVIIQIVSNNLLNIYGATSIYGSNIPIAVAGIVFKINTIFTTIIIGLYHGSQPIIGYSYGAKLYGRVRETFKLVIKLAVIVSVVFWLIFQLFPSQIISLFGSGNALYMEFAVKYMHIFLFFVFLNGVQIACSNFFQAIGNARNGVILSLAKQIVFLLPLLVVLPIFMGLDGILYATPISDLIAFILAIALIYNEFKHMPKEDMVPSSNEN